MAGTAIYAGVADTLTPTHIFYMLPCRGNEGYMVGSIHHYSSERRVECQAYLKADPGKIPCNIAIRIIHMNDIFTMML
jgi:hypothetical protein